jgi:hypothetical protein
MSKRWASILVLGSALAVTCTGVTTAYQIEPRPSVELSLSGGFKPARLPKHELAPVHFELEGTVAMRDGSQPPEMNELLAEIDKSVVVGAKGLASCRIQRLVGPDAVPGACKLARIGNGELDFRVEFSEVPPFVAKGRAVVYNGGTKQSLTTIYVVAFLHSPVSAAVVVTGKVSKVHDGPYGTKWSFPIPIVAGGAASLTKFRLEFFRRFAYRHEVQSYLLAKCPGGKLRAQAESFFSGNAAPLIGSFSRPCTPRD